MFARVAPTQVRCATPMMLYLFWMPEAIFTVLSRLVPPAP